MLIYTTLMTFINIIAFLCSLVSLFSSVENGTASDIVKATVIVIAFVLNSVIFVTILLFLKYHLQLIFSNYTTLETLELKRQGKNSE